MLATMPPMGRQKEQLPTATVRVDADLARLASVIAIAEGVSVPKLLSEILRPVLEKRRAKSLKMLTEELSPSDETE